MAVTPPWILSDKALIASAIVGAVRIQKVASLWIELILRWTSAISGRFGKNVTKSRYSASACLNACPEYRESAQLIEGLGADWWRFLREDLPMH
jgi:hypothetical protein